MLHERRLRSFITESKLAVATLSILSYPFLYAPAFLALHRTPVHWAVATGSVCLGLYIWRKAYALRDETIMQFSQMKIDPYYDLDQEEKFALGIVKLLYHYGIHFLSDDRIYKDSYECQLLEEQTNLKVVKINKEYIVLLNGDATITLTRKRPFGVVVNDGTDLIAMECNFHHVVLQEHVDEVHQQAMNKRLAKVTRNIFPTVERSCFTDDEIEEIHLLGEEDHIEDNEWISLEEVLHG